MDGVLFRSIPYTARAGGGPLRGATAKGGGHRMSEIRVPGGTEVGQPDIGVDGHDQPYLVEPGFLSHITHTLFANQSR